MDVDIEKIHETLTDADLPSSIHDLKNPTESFVVNLMNAFLKRFQIDVSVLDKPTIAQRDVMSYCEDCDIIGLINLHVVMVQICDRIFCNGLCITDITNPGTKKLRKQAKLLANFILYATNKETEIEEKVCEIQNNAKILDDMLKQKNMISETINEKALHISKQLSIKEKCTIEIEELRSKHERNNKKNIKMQDKVTAAERKKKEAMELYGTYKAQVLELQKTIADLQLGVVKSPEKYQKDLSEIEQQQSTCTKEFKLLKETYQEKKHLLERQKNILTFIQKELDKFTVVRDAYKQLKEVSQQEDSIQKQVDVLNADIAELKRRLQSQKDQCKDTEINVIHELCEERLSSLRNMCNQLISNKELLKKKLEDVQIQHNEDFLKLQKMQNQIKKLEDETLVLVKNCQDVYDNEIVTEKSFMENMDK